MISSLRKRSFGSVIADLVAAPSPQRVAPLARPARWQGLVGERYSDVSHGELGKGSVTPHPPKCVDSLAMPSPTRGALPKNFILPKNASGCRKSLERSYCCAELMCLANRHLARRACSVR